MTHRNGDFAHLIAHYALWLFSRVVGILVVLAPVAWLYSSGSLSEGRIEGLVGLGVIALLALVVGIIAKFCE